MAKHNEDSCRVNRRAVQDTLDVIGGKWKILILLTLSDGPRRFKQLANEIGITPRMLSKELQEMEGNKLIDRKILTTKPVGIEYSITEHGLSFQHVMEAMRDWGLKHRNKIMSRKP